MTWSIRTLWFCALTALIVTAPGCIPRPKNPIFPLPPLIVHAPNATCEQVNQIAYSIVRENYAVSSFTPATPTSPGVIEGSRPKPAGWDDTVRVTVSCSGEAQAQGDYGLSFLSTLGAQNRRFPEYFFSRFTGMIDAAQRKERGEEKLPQGQMQVKLQPLTGFDTTVEFGQDLSSVLPVRVEILNTTTRWYTLEVERLYLLTAQGVRVPPMSGVSHSVYPKPPLDAQMIAPGATLKGYLYYPPGSYTGARGTLLEEESQEREGFEVQF